MRVGFVGLGTMGRPMAVNLLKAGHELAVFDLDPAAVDALAVAGATVAGSAREAAAGREAVVTMQPWVEIDRSTYISEVGTRLSNGGCLRCRRSLAQLVRSRRPGSRPAHAGDGQARPISRHLTPWISGVRVVYEPVFEVDPRGFEPLTF